MQRFVYEAGVETSFVAGFAQDMYKTCLPYLSFFYNYATTNFSDTWGSKSWSKIVKVRKKEGKNLKRKEEKKS